MYLRSFSRKNYTFDELCLERKHTVRKLRSTQTVRKPSTTKTSEKSAKNTLLHMSSVSETSFESRHLADESGSIKRQLLEIPT